MTRLGGKGDSRPEAGYDAWYRIYGLHLHCDRPIPGLASTQSAPSPDLRIWFHAWPASPGGDPRIREPVLYESPYRGDGGEPNLKLWELEEGWGFRMLFADETEFLVDRRGTRVWARWPAHLTVEDTASYLLGPVLAFVLRLRGVCSLHASAVGITEEAVAFVGPPGAGKSTLAACFARRGYIVVSDDNVALIEQNGGVLVPPAFPRLGLWPDAVEAMFGSPDALPLQTPTWEKRYLDLTADGYSFGSRPLPLAALYILGGRPPDLRTPAATRLSPREALLALVRNSYVNYLLDRQMRARELELLGRLVTRLPVRQVFSPPDFAYVPEVCDAVLEDFRHLAAG